MKIKSQKDFWSGLMFVVVGIVFAWGATNYSFGVAARPGPGYFPFGLGILLAILGFAIKGLLWLAILGIVFFVITLIVGWLRRGASRS